jgi:SAM-dependent methyltransferase
MNKCPADETNAGQAAYWNGDPGETWVRQAEGLDFMLCELGEALLERAALRQGERVLDIGCGSGAVTIAAQDRLGEAGQALGLDISRPLIAKAQLRASDRSSRASFIQADAATWRDELPGDALVSRFGVMFFDHPEAAFTNLLQLVKPSGRFNFVCWASPKESDLASGLMTAVAPLFRKPDTLPDPTAPGPYAFADRSRVATILCDAGWREITFERWEGRLPVPGATTRECATFVARIGAIARLMREQNVGLDLVIDALIPSLEQRMEHGQVRLRAAAWFVSARR